MVQGLLEVKKSKKGENTFIWIVHLVVPITVDKAKKEAFWFVFVSNGICFIFLGMGRPRTLQKVMLFWCSQLRLFSNYPFNVINFNWGPFFVT